MTEANHMISRLGFGLTYAVAAFNTLSIHSIRYMVLCMAKVQDATCIDPSRIAIRSVEDDSADLL